MSVSIIVVGRSNHLLLILKRGMVPETGAISPSSNIFTKGRERGEGSFLRLRAVGNRGARRNDYRFRSLVLRNDTSATPTYI